MNTSRSIIGGLEEILRIFATETIGGNFEISKYHHDVYSIALSWQGEDGIGRDIHIIIDGSPFASSNYLLNSEINAWLDDEVSLERKWWHTAGPDGVFLKDSSDFSYEKTGEIVAMLAKAYKMVQSCNESSHFYWKSHA